MTTKYPIRLTHQGFMQLATCLILRQSISVNHKMHWHEFYEITFVMDGYGSQILNGQQRDLQPGTIFFLIPTDCHQVSPAPGSTLEIFNFVFTEELITEELRQLLFKDNLDYYTVLEGNQFKAVENAYWTLDNELSQKKPGQRLVIKGALEHIAVELVRSCQGKDRKKTFISTSLPGLPYPPIQHPSIQRALTYIHNCYRKPLTLEDAAEQAQLTPNYFSECFKTATGESFQNYLQNLRLKFAVAMLISSDLPVTDICYASGYNTLSHFTRAFKQKYGQSPTAYRHNQQLTQADAPDPNHLL
jgi:AraC-like DNA-binding protein